MRQQTAATLRTAVVFAVVVIVVVWLGRGALAGWLRTLHGMH